MTPPDDDWNRTPTRPIRVPLELWARFGEATTRAKTDRSKALRDFMAWYVHDEGVKMPRRPGPAATPEESAEPTE